MESSRADSGPETHAESDVTERIVTCETYSQLLCVEMCRLRFTCELETARVLSGGSGIAAALGLQQSLVLECFIDDGGLADMQSTGHSTNVHLQYC